MVRDSATRRGVLRAAAAGGALALAPSTASGTAASGLDAHTGVTYRAVVDAVVPATPALGNEHVPGGLAIDLDEFLVTFVNDLFSFGLPGVGAVGNLPLAAPIAGVLDAAAELLLAKGENESEPSVDRPISLLGPDDASPWVVRFAAGPFAKLARRDRLRAVALLDDLEVDVSPTPDRLYELDGGLVGQLVTGFTEVLYYSERQGYDDFARPPSEREHPNDPAAVQSWRQTGFPGFADGYAALRGYLGTPDGPLGDGEVWTTIDGGDEPVQIRLSPGEFAENDYDTSDYAEPYPEPDGAGAGGD